MSSFFMKGGIGVIKLFTLPSSLSSRRAHADLIEEGVPFVYQNMQTQSGRLTFEQFKEILSYTTEGVEEIIANGKEKKLLEAEGVDFDKITLSELYYYVKRFPRLMKAPITIGKDIMVIGHNDEYRSIFKSRKARMQLYSIQLEEVRANEEERLAQGELIATGQRR